MLLEYHEKLSANQHLEGVWKILCRYDHEFIPPLSARENTYQSELASHLTIKQEPKQYFDILKQQSFLLAMDKDEVIGFMAFRFNYVCKDLEDDITTIYITTIIVNEEYRGRGITTAFYAQMLKIAQQRNQSITTRTWSTNRSHIKVLEKIGLQEIKRIENGRGPEIDTVYFRKQP